MQTWTYPDVRPISSGPWDDEPDKAQWIDENTGLDCLIVRNHGGALCGYVGVPPGHPWHGVDYGDIELYPDVHGGLSFAESCHEVDDPKANIAICHIPEPGRPEHVWWLGFDCAHPGDLIPNHDRELRNLSSYRALKSTYHDTYRHFGYVREQVTLLAAQAGRAA